MITLKHVAEKWAVAVRRRHDALREHRSRTDHHATCRPAQGIPLTGTEPAVRSSSMPAGRPIASRGAVRDRHCAENIAHCTGVRPGWPGCLAARGPHSEVTLDEGVRGTSMKYSARHYPLSRRARSQSRCRRRSDSRSASAAPRDARSSRFFSKRTRVLHADHDQPLLVLLRPGANIRKRAQPIDARIGAELDEDDLSDQGRGRQRRRIEPRRCTAQSRDVAWLALHSPPMRRTGRIARPRASSPLCQESAGGHDRVPLACHRAPTSLCQGWP